MNRFVDSFDHYLDSDLTKKWTILLGVGATIVNGGRHNKGCRLNAGFVASGAISLTIDYQSSWTCGWAFYNTLSSDVPRSSVYQLLANGTEIVSLLAQNDSTLAIQSQTNIYGDTSTIPIPFVFNPNTWYYFEFQTNLSTSGLYVAVNAILRVNGVTLLNVNFVTTIKVSAIVTGTAAANRHIFASAGTGDGSIIDDLYINDGTGVKNTSFIGDVEIGTLFANGDNATTWSIYPTTPTAHYLKINEQYEDGDSTYIESNVIGDVERFEWQDIPGFNGTIPAVQISFYARKTDERYRAFSPLIGVYESPNPSYVNDNYKYYRYNYDQNPNLGTDWTTTNFNAETFAVKVTV